MKLTFIPSTTIRREVSGLFLKGADALEWYRFIAAWNVRPELLECYIIPQSKEDISPKGLFIIFPSGKSPSEPGKAILYGNLGQKLFLPIDSEIFPAVTARELDDWIHWDRLVFHPSVGTVGFNISDQFDLADGVDMPNVLPENWSGAQKGNSPRPRIKEIIVHYPPKVNFATDMLSEYTKKNMEDILKDFENGMDSKKKTLERLKRQYLLGGLASLAELRKKFGEKGEGMLDDLEEWLEQDQSELEKQRQKEINRLLKMFRDNPEEALKYALPLNQRYGHRGMAPPSSNLIRGDASFNLGALGGGGFGDYWSVGLDKYEEMRRQYLAVANQLVKEKNFRKAAYVYAQLLGDYSSAANVLRQGHHYREAAVIYKDHLDNQLAAAECYEKGSMYFDAIREYDDLKMFEKAGDLCVTIEDTERAAGFFHQAIEAVVERNDYLSAARIYNAKLKDEPAARKVLLDAWEMGRDPENCLLRYFDFVHENEEMSKEGELSRIYEKDVNSSRYELFLSFMKRMNDKFQDEPLKDLSRGFAYDIVSKQVDREQYVALHQLSYYLPHDRLITGDSSRYIVKMQSLKPWDVNGNRKKLKLVNEIVLDRAIKWKTTVGVMSGSQFMAAGSNDNEVWVSMWNSSGKVISTKYISDEFDDKMTLYLRQGVFGKLREIIISSNPSYSHFYRMNFQAGVEFPVPVFIGQPSWLPENTIGLAMSADARIYYALVAESGRAVIQTFQNGKLKKSVDCILNEKNTPVFAKPGDRYLDAFISKKQVYFARDRFLIRSKITGGESEYFDVGFKVKGMAHPRPFKALKVVLWNDNVCQLFKPKVLGLNPVGSLFGQEVKDIRSVCLISKYVVVAGTEKICIYNNSHHKRTPTVQGSYMMDEPVVSIVPGTEDQRFYVLTESGRVMEMEIS